MFHAFFTFVGFGFVGLVWSLSFLGDLRGVLRGVVRGDFDAAPFALLMCLPCSKMCMFVRHNNI